jgi:hypothetical protein
VSDPGSRPVRAARPGGPISAHRRRATRRPSMLVTASVLVHGRTSKATLSHRALRICTATTTS